MSFASLPNTWGSGKLFSELISCVLKEYQPVMFALLSTTSNVGKGKEREIP
jgi:hypothetical protein